MTIMAKMVLPPLLLFYKQVSPSLKYTLSVLICVLVGGGIFLPLYLSKINQLKTLQSEIKEVEETILKGQQLQARCAPLTEEEKRTRSEMREKFSKGIPPEGGLLVLVKDIANIAQECSIYDISFSMATTAEHSSSQKSSTLKAATVTGSASDPSLGASTSSFTQGIEGEGITLNQISLRTTFHCRYQDLADFLKGISTLPRIIEVESITIERKLPLMDVEIALNAFYSEGRQDA
jgi:Tfp pilus assembly protein PilO